MDKEFIKTIISTKDGKDDRLIKRGDLVDLELFELLCSSTTSKIDQAFYKYDDKANKDDAIYYMQVKCPQCGQTLIFAVYIDGEIKCTRCRNRIRIQKEKSEEHAHTELVE